MSREVEVHVPDIGDFDAVDVVEILVAPGDRVAIEDPLVSLESDKATMEVPSPVAGEVRSVKVSLGDAVSEGSLLMVVTASEEARDEPSETTGSEATGEPSPAHESSATGEPSPARGSSATEGPAPAPASSATGAPSPTQATSAERAPSASAQHAPGPVEAVPFAEARGVDRPVRAHAAPLVRRAARELGVDLARVEGTGPKGRVLDGDLKAHVRAAFEQGLPSAGATSARSRLADVHDLEIWRRRIPASEAEPPPSILAVIVKAAVAALRALPELSGEEARPVHVGVVDGTDLVVVPDAPTLRLRALAALLDPAAEGDAAVEPSFRLHHALGRAGAMPEPVRAERDLFAVAVGDLEVVPRWSGTPGDALDEDTQAGFEPRLVVPLSISTHPDLSADLGARFLDLWAEILASPARLLL